MPRGFLAPCAGCGAVVHGKTRVRVGQNREDVFCADCLPAAREQAQKRFYANGRRWARWAIHAARAA